MQLFKQEKSTYFLICTLLEIVCCTLLFDKWPYLNPLLLISFTILSSYFAFQIALTESQDRVKVQNFKIKNYILVEIGLIALMSIILIWCHYLFLEIPNNPNSSDIVPSIELYVKRFVNFEYPYKPMNFGNWTVQPNYFPLRWIPFVFSEFLKIDYRYSPIILLFIVLFFIRLKEFRNQSLSIKLILTQLFPFFIVVLILYFLKIEFLLSAEFLIIFYYLIFLLLLNSKNTFLIALGISLCLLSRYTLVFWLLFYGFYFFNTYGKKEFIKLNLYIILFFALIFGPYLVYDINQSLLNGLKYYEISARGIWNTASWQNIGDKPHHLKHGLNFSIYSYKWFYPNIDKAFQFMKIIHLILVILIPIAFIGWYQKIKTKIKDEYLFIVQSFKFYIVMFFMFFSAPFPYLFFVPLFINILTINRVLKK